MALKTRKKHALIKPNNVWKYAIKGITKDDLIVRVIVAFDKEGMIIITVMHVLDKR